MFSNVHTTRALIYAQGYFVLIFETLNKFSHLLVFREAQKIRVCCPYIMMILGTYKLRNKVF